MPTIKEKARARQARQQQNARIRRVLTVLHRKGELHPRHAEMIADAFGADLRGVRMIMGNILRDARETKAQTGVFVTARSQGVKTGVVAASYVAQTSCPSDCAFLHHGCYAENGFVGGMITKRLNRLHDPGLTAFDLALNEATQIDRLPADVDLRLHIVGDSTTIEGTVALADACDRYVARSHVRASLVDPGRKAKVWTYTHAWRTVPRAAWGGVAVLASCETPGDIVAAQSAGYATALTLESHPSPKRYDLGLMRIMPCPEQTRGVTCVNCRLCMNDEYLRTSGTTIAFALHGKKFVALEAVRERRRADASRATLFIVVQ